MARAKLTEKRARSLRPDPKSKRDTFLRDAELIGFGVRCKPSGVRSYIVEYRNAAGRNRRMVLGPVGTLRLKDARDLAQEHLTSARAGGDPLAARQARRQARSLAECAAAYLEEHLRLEGKPSTQYEFRRVLEREILPLLGSRQAQELTRDDVRRLHRSIGERSHRTANHALAILRAVLAWSEREGLVAQGAADCARRVPKYPERRRERYLSPAELARLGDVLRETDAAGTEHPSAVLALRLLLLSGMRRGEALSLRWREVDFERGAITLHEHKTSGRDGAAKVLPITAPVRELLAGARREQGNAYVVTGLRPGRPFVGLQKVWERIRERAGLEDVRLHDLRHGYASVGAAGGESLLVVGKLLGHGDQATTQRYAHLADDPVRAAAERISETIARALAGSEGGDVVRIESGRPGR